MSTSDLTHCVIRSSLVVGWNEKRQSGRAWGGDTVPVNVASASGQRRRPTRRDRSGLGSQTQSVATTSSAAINNIILSFGAERSV